MKDKSIKWGGLLILIVALAGYLVFIHTNMSFNWALRRNGLLITGNIIHQSSDLNGDNFIIFQTQQRDTEMPAIVHLTRNSFGLWQVEINITMTSEHDNILTTSWVNGVLSNVFESEITTVFENHLLFYGNTAVRKISDDLIEFIPQGVGVRVWQVENDFFIHLITFGYEDILSDINIIEILNDNNFIE